VTPRDAAPAAAGRAAAPSAARTLALGLSVALLIAGAASPLAGQGAGSGATTVLRIPPGPRPLALGNAFVAVEDAWALEYNPAAARVAAPTVAAAYQALPVGASAGAAAFVAPAGPALSLGVSLRFVDYGTIDVLEPDPGLPVGRPTGATATGGEVSGLVGGSIRWGRLAVGVAGRALRLDVAGLSDQVAAADAGLAWWAAPGLQLGVAIQHLGGEMEAGRPAPLPRTIRGGAALHHSAGFLSVRLVAEARRREERTGFGGGLEVGGGSDGLEAILRMGYETRPHAGDVFSPFVIGGGVRVERLSIDLAYRALGPLAATRQVGLSYRF
jgi:hypothetical protein